MRRFLAKRKKRLILTLILFFLFLLSFRYNEITLVDSLIGFNTEDLQMNGYQEDYDDFSGLVPSYEEEKVEYLGVRTILAHNQKVVPKGRIIIPGKVDAPIFEGINNAHLTKGIAEQAPRSEVVAGGRGNYILAGHNWYGKPGKLFGSLRQVEVGDLVYVTDRYNLYIYRIYIQDTVHKDNPYLLNIDTEDKKIITLYTCYGLVPSPSPITRYTVQGELEKTYSLDNLSFSRFSEITSTVR